MIVTSLGVGVHSVVVVIPGIKMRILGSQEVMMATAGPQGVGEGVTGALMGRKRVATLGILWEPYGFGEHCASVVFFR